MALAVLAMHVNYKSWCSIKPKLGRILEIAFSFTQIGLPDVFFLWEDITSIKTVTNQLLQSQAKKTM